MEPEKLQNLSVHTVLLRPLKRGQLIARAISLSLTALAATFYSGRQSALLS
jgi:hypothetical protein